MREYLKFYIDGQWVDPVRPKTLTSKTRRPSRSPGRSRWVRRPTSTRRSRPPGEPSPSWSQTSREERLDLLQAILAEYQKRVGDLADAVTEEMGAPPSLAAGPQVRSGSAT